MRKPGGDRLRLPACWYRSRSNPPPKQAVRFSAEPDRRACLTVGGGTPATAIFYFYMFLQTGRFRGPPRSTRSYSGREPGGSSLACCSGASTLGHKSGFRPGRLKNGFRAGLFLDKQTGRLQPYPTGIRQNGIRGQISPTPSGAGDNRLLFPG
jgi:hypothetical protein